MGKQRRFATLLAVWTVGCSASGGYSASVSDFLDFSRQSESGAVLLPGRLYVPPEALNAPDDPRPLILFLHGAGQRGTDNLRQINVSIDNLLAAAKQRGAFLYAPQCTTSWADLTVTTNTSAMLDRALSDYNVDPFRFYVTGLSLGGGGVWNMMNRYPDRFAAGAPIAGVAPAAGFVPANLVDQSVWAFHARNDPTVSYATSRNVVNSILAAAGQPLPIYPGIRDTTTWVDYASSALDLRYLEAPVGGHDIWHAVYGYEPLYDWMFARTTAVSEPGVGIPLIAGIGSMLLFKIRRRGGTPGYLK